jgi:sorbitol-specific phosphotransferase system component IIC
MFLVALLMMKKLFQMLTKNIPFLMNIPTKMTKNRVFSWFLWNLVARFMYMMIMNLILGRAMKEKRKS